jgi:hypothetical protein
MFPYHKTSKEIELVYEVVNDSKWYRQIQNMKKAVFFTNGAYTDLPARKNEDDSPSLRYFTPHIIVM